MRGLKTRRGSPGAGLAKKLWARTRATPRNGKSRARGKLLESFRLSYAGRPHGGPAAPRRTSRAADECGHREQNAFAHLRKAIELEHRWRERARKDPEFQGVRSTIAYRLLVLGLRADRDARAILRGTELFSCCKWGAMGNSLGVRLQADGTATLWTRAEPGTPARSVNHPGRWRTEGETVILELSSPYQGAIRFTGQLKTGPYHASIEFPEPIGQLLSVDSSRCDA